MGLPPQKYKNLFQDKKIEITAKADKKLSFNFNYRKYVFFKTKKKATAPPIFSASSVYNKQKSRYIKKAPEQRFKLTINEIIEYLTILIAENSMDTKNAKTLSLTPAAKNDMVQIKRALTNSLRSNLNNPTLVLENQSFESLLELYLSFIN